MVLKFYELWDNGNYYDANEDYKKIKTALPGFLPPYAVEVLGSYWPHGENLLDDIKKLETGDDQTSPLYVRNPDMLIYAKDELGKIRRLIDINRDYRSALIRSVGLGEVLLKARITCLWNQSLLEIAACDEGTQRPKDFYPMDKLPPEIKEWLDEIKGVVFTISMNWIIPALRYNSTGRFKSKSMAVSCKKDQSKEKIFFVRRCSEKTSHLDKTIIFADDHRELRNKAAHTYLSVPQPIAEDVYKKALANFEDFVENWVKFMESSTPPDKLNDPQRFEIKDWELLCKWCHIHEFLPPISEGKEND